MVSIKSFVLAMRSISSYFACSVVIFAILKYIIKMSVLNSNYFLATLARMFMLGFGQSHMEKLQAGLMKGSYFHLQPVRPV